jgi:hypothetical protein
MFWHITYLITFFLFFVLFCLSEIGCLYSPIQNLFRGSLFHFIHSIELHGPGIGSSQALYIHTVRKSRNRRGHILMPRVEFDPTAREFQIINTVPFLDHNVASQLTPWPDSAIELYRPSDRRLSAKLVPTFMDIGCYVVSMTESYGHILGFLVRNRYFFLQIAPQLYSRGWVDAVPDPLLLWKSGSSENRTRTFGFVL